jgi:RNA polymerase sigma factor (sigma-70 family)
VNYHARSRWLAEQVLPHEPAIRARLRHLTRMTHMDVDDIVQETYAILARLKSVESVHNPRAYALQVAKSVFLQALRQEKVVAIGSISDLASLDTVDDYPSPEQHASGQQELRRVQTAIRMMPPRVREVFWLRRVHGLSQRETAQQLGLAEHTIEKYMSRGIKFLLSQFERGGNALPDASDSIDPRFAGATSADGRSRTGP